MTAGTLRVGAAENEAGDVTADDKMAVTRLLSTFLPAASVECALRSWST